MSDVIVSQAKDLCINWDIECDLYINAVKVDETWRLLDVCSNISADRERNFGFIEHQLKNNREKWICLLEKNKVAESDFIWDGFHATKYEKYIGLQL